MREDGNWNSDDSTRGRAKWTDQGHTSQELMTDWTDETGPPAAPQTFQAGCESRVFAIAGSYAWNSVPIDTDLTHFFN